MYSMQMLISPSLKRQNSVSVCRRSTNRAAAGLSPVVCTVVADDVRRVALVKNLQLGDDLFLDGRLDFEVNAFASQNRP